ncbi:hypothetical protein Tco_0586250 [Tanacetum coccineum]
MSSSTVTYTSVYTYSEPGRVFWGADEESSDGGPPRVILYGYDGLPMQPVAPPSPNYVPGPEHPPSPDYVLGPEHPPSPVDVPYVPEPKTMNPIAAQQVALDNALVAPEKRVHMAMQHKIDPTKTHKEPTYQVVFGFSCTLISLSVLPIHDRYSQKTRHSLVSGTTSTRLRTTSLHYKFKLDKKQCIIDVEVFCDILQICPRLLNQEFDAPPSDEEIATFIKELEHKVTLNLSLMWLLIKCTNHGELLLQSSTSVFVLGKSLVLIRSDFQEHKYYRVCTTTRMLTLLNTYWETSVFRKTNKDHKETIQYLEGGFIPNQQSVLGTLRLVSKSDEYQVYGALLPEGMFNQQMRDSPAHKTYLAFTIGAATPKRARKFKKPSSSSFSSKKKTLVNEGPPSKDRIESKEIELLSDAALLEEAQLKKAIKQSRRERISHKAVASSEEDITDEDDKAVDYQKNNDDEEEDEFVHTLDDYVPTDDEDVDDEEFECINKEMYSDVNVELKDSEREATTSTTTAADSSTLTAIHQRLSDVENEDKTLINVDHSSTIRATLKSEVPIVVKEYLRTSWDDALYKELQRHTA